MTRTVHVLSLGAGVQSSTLWLKGLKEGFEFEGERVKPEIAIFADTMNEPKEVYEWFEWLKVEAAKYGGKLITTSYGDIFQDAIDAVDGGRSIVGIPFFTKQGAKKGMLMRQCTGNYKIFEVRRAIRRYLGYSSNEKVKERIVMWIGISTDEVTRVKPSKVKYIEHFYPLIEEDMSREDCIKWFEGQEYNRPPKSACIVCPFRDNASWAEMKKKNPDDFKMAVDFDEKMRKLPMLKTGECFLHPSRTPLKDIEFHEQKDIFDMFDNECEGMCGL